MSLENHKFTRRDVLKGAAAIAVTSALINDSMPEKLEKKTPLTAIEQRFSSRMEIGGNLTNTIDILPDKLSDKPAMIVAPGFNASIHTNALMLEQLASDRRVLSLDHPHAGRDIRAMDADEWQRVAKYPFTELRKASNLLDLIETKGINEKIDCFAFSEGALNAVLAAYMHPEKFNSLVLSAPAGLIGEDSLWSLAGMRDPEQRGLLQRFSTQGATDDTIGMPSIDNFHSQFPELAAEEKRVRDYIAEVWKEDEATAKRHPIATIEDAWAIAHMRIDDMIAFIRAAGVKVAVLSGIDDQVFPHSKMAGTMDEATGKITPGTLHTGQLDGYMTTVGAHGPHYSARIVGHLFDMLGAKRKKEEAEQERAATQPH